MANWIRRGMRLAAVLATCAVLPASACAQDDYGADAKRLVAALGLAAGDTVADIGAGGGELAVELARVVGPSGRVYATELEGDRLRDLRQVADSGELRNITVIEAHATRTNLPAGCCDAVVLRRVYHHIGNPRLMNESLRSSLRPGGFLAILDFAPDGSESADPGGRADGNQHGVTAATVVKELGEAGFEQVKVEDADRPGRYLVVGRRPGG